MNNTTISQFLMKHAFYLGVLFCVEYYLTIIAITDNILWGGLASLIKISVPFVIYYILRNLRNNILEGILPGLQAWMCGVQLMFFSGLIEAAFSYIYHAFISPTALRQYYAQMIAYLEQFQSIVGKTGISDETIDMYRKANIPSAIENAFSILSSDISVGMFLMLIIAPIVAKKASSISNS